MARVHLDYTQRRDVQAQGFNADVPVEGWYTLRLRSGGVLCGILIYFGEPLDPITAEPLDRSPRWCARCNGEHIEVERVWPKCADRPSNEAEYQHLSRLQEWGRENDPDSGIADPRRKLDPLTTPLMF